MARSQYMGFWAVLGLIVGAQLGTGMFLLPGQLSPYGIWGILTWAITGGGALALSLVFAILARYVPAMGGPQVYVFSAFGKNAAFYTAWIYWVISWVSSIPVILLFIGALEHLIGTLGAFYKVLIEISTLLSLMALNLKGARLSGIGEIIFSSLKVVPLLVIPFFAFFHADFSYISFPKDMTPLNALNQASLLGFWGYIGLECGTTVANCVQNPGKVIPRALFWGSLVVTTVYVLNSLAVMSVVPPDILQASISPYSDLLNRTLGPIGARCMSFLIIIMCLGTLNSWLLASSQIAMVASREKLFPAFFSRENRFNSPYGGVIITTLALCLGVFILQNHSLKDQLNLFITFSTSMFIVVYLMSSLSLAKLVWVRQIPSRPGIIFIMMLALIFCIWFLMNTRIIELLGALSIPVLGGALRHIFKWGQNEAS